MAHFRAFSVRFGEGRERARKLATRWLCWQSAANPSPLPGFPDPPEDIGNFIDWAPGADLPKGWKPRCADKNSLTIRTGNYLRKTRSAVPRVRKVPGNICGPLRAVIGFMLARILWSPLSSASYAPHRFRWCSGLLICIHADNWPPRLHSTLEGGLNSRRTAFACPSLGWVLEGI